jgi:hypothetical protein
MTARTLSGSYAAGYLVSSSVTNLFVAPGASIGGFGLVTASYASVSNEGKIEASNGANGFTQDAGGGFFVNQGYDNGGAAIASSGAGAAGRLGGAGAYFADSGGFGANLGEVTGGAGGAGIQGAGSVVGGGGGGGGAGMRLNVGGEAGNSGLIVGGAGGSGGASGLGQTAQNSAGIGGAGGTGVYLSGPGSVSNHFHVYGGMGGRGGYGTNYGGHGGAGGAAIETVSGGSVDNYAGFVHGGAGGYGGFTDKGNYGGTGGQGGAGVQTNAGGTVTNGGTIRGGTGGGGGGVTNGQKYGGDGGYGGAGVLMRGGGLVVNQGLIEGGAGGKGVAGTHYGSGIGGAGGAGVALYDGGTVQNNGAILGAAHGGGYFYRGNGVGIYIYGTGSITNGSSSDHAALIGGGTAGAYGAVGVYAGFNSQVTVTNYGTISGGAPTSAAVYFQSSLDTLVVEAGSAFIGTVYGFGSELVLASGTGAVSGSVGGAFFVSGSMPMTAFESFATLEVGAGATFTVTGDGDVSDTGGEAATLINAGTLSIATQLSVEGILDDSGKLTGATGSGLLIDGGLATFTKGASLSVPTVELSGAADVVVGTNLSFAHKWDQTAGTLTVDAGKTFTLTGGGSSFSGLVTGAGRGQATVDFDLARGGTETFNGVTISGVDLQLADTKISVGAAGVTISSTAVLDFDGSGAGLTGTGTVMNTGMIEATAASGATIAGVVDNTGTLAAIGGDLTLHGAVAGTGAAIISNATLDFMSTFVGNVDFSTGAGVLVLAKSRSYTGAVEGFSPTGGTSLDLQDIGFTSPNEATFTGGATSGVLTVTDGTHTAKITLTGDFLTSTFTATGDGHGGVLITDPSTPRPPPSHAFLSAMAGLGAIPAAGSAPPSGHASMHAAPLLAMPAIG